MSDRYTFKDHAYERQLFLSRLLVGGGFSLLLILVLVARLVYLQIYQHEYYSSKSDGYRIHVQPVPPVRGRIYDRNGVLLADNRPSYTLTLVKENAGNIDASLDLLRDLIGFTSEEEEKFRTQLKRRAVPFSSVPLRINLSEDEIARIAVNQFRLPGISIEAQLVRHYPQGELLAHALGYVASISEEELKAVDPVNYRGTQHIGKLGIEKHYESLLHGAVGYETVEKNARGQIMKVLDRVDPVPGEDIVLHIDAGLQKAAAEALGDYRGGIVALDPQTGGVLAMVSTPSFDPNLFVGGISRADYARLRDDTIGTPLFNRALGRYAPGSTIKPFLGLAALDTGLRTREYTVHDPGWFRLDNHSHVFRDWTWWDNKSGHDLVNLEKAIYQSCDVYFYDLATDMGIDEMHDFLFQFGFGRNTAIDIPQASSGVLPSQEWKRRTLGQPWYPGETVNSSIGQGYTLATPLQLATATMLMANRGQWHQPVMLKSKGLDQPDIRPTTYLPDIHLQREEDWDFIRDAMVSVVHKGNGGYRNNGTAYSYIGMKDAPPYRMAGKSGTAQVVAMARDFDKKTAEVPELERDHALFIAFAPADDPKIAIAVFIENGKSGSGLAGPIARQVIDAWLLQEDGQFKPEFQPALSLPLISSREP